MKSVEKSRKFVYRVSLPHFSYWGKVVCNISSPLTLALFVVEIQILLSLLEISNWQSPFGYFKIKRSLLSRAFISI